MRNNSVKHASAAPLRRGLLVFSFAMSILALQPAPAAESISCKGVTEPVFDVTLSLPVAGIITTLRFKEGDFVQTNDVILELDHRLEEIEEIGRASCRERV